MIELTDCSPSGIGFLSQVALAVGDKFTISIMLSTLSQLIYAVRHCRAADGARYMIGAEFMGFASSDADADRQLIFESLLRLE